MMKKHVTELIARRTNQPTTNERPTSAAADTAPPTIPVDVLTSVPKAAGIRVTANGSDTGTGSGKKKPGDVPRTADGRRIAAGLARKSALDAEGIRAQLTACEQKAEADGAFIPEDDRFRFVDDATSGRKIDREGLRRLKAVLTSGEQPPFSILYIKDRTRLARSEDPRWIFWFEIHCEENGVEVRYLDEPPPPLGPDGRPAYPPGHFLLHAVKNYYTTEELNKTLSRTRGGRRARCRRGFWPRGSAPYAMVRFLANLATGDLVCAVPADQSIRREGHAYKLQWGADGETETVKRIFSLLDAGWSLHAVARLLNTEGVPSPAATQAHARGRTAGPWTSDAVRHIAMEPLYKGDLWYGRTTPSAAPMVLGESVPDEYAGPVQYPNFMAPPLIDPERWDRVYARLQRTPTAGPGRSSGRYLLSGIPRCAHCGCLLVGQRSVHERMPGERVEYRYYWHRSTDRERSVHTRCMYAGRLARADILESQTEAAVRAMVADPALTAAISSQCTALIAADTDAALQREYRDAEAQLARISSEYQVEEERFFSLESDAAITFARTRYEAKCAELAAARARLEAIAGRAEMLNGVRDRIAVPGAQPVRGFDTAIAASANEERQRLYQTLVESLVVDFDSGRATLSLFAFEDSTLAA